MTGYTVHTGSTKKFAANWDDIFKGKTSQKTVSSSGKTSARPAKKGAKTKQK